MESLRKRRRNDRPETVEVTSQLPPLLERLRNMWQFSNLCQWFSIFGGVVKLDHLDIDVCFPILIYALPYAALRGSDIVRLLGFGNTMHNATLNSPARHRAGSTQVSLVPSRFNVRPPRGSIFTKHSARAAANAALETSFSTNIRGASMHRKLRIYQILSELEKFPSNFRASQFSGE